MVAVIKNSSEWNSVRDRIDLVAVAQDLLGDPESRSSGAYYWRCPLHGDTKPSFEIKEGSCSWRCRGCDAWGDAIKLVREVKGFSFVQALKYLSRDEFFLDEGDVRIRSSTRSPSDYVPSGLPETKALELVAAAQRSLHLPENGERLAYLTDFRCLSVETIRAHRLGWAEDVLVPKSDGGWYCTTGWVIPCFDAKGRIAGIQVRRLNDKSHKYDTIYLDRQRFICYPGPGAIRPSRPLIVAEGPFDALLVGQVLGEHASVVTLGGTSERPGPSFLSRALALSTRQYIALDNDGSGDNASARWPASFRRVKPPGFKDWTDAHRNRVDLLQGWLDILSGGEPGVWDFELLRYEPE
jgi:DNA primase